jgi:hypothetical protein
VANENGRKAFVVPNLGKVAANTAAVATATLTSPWNDSVVQLNRTASDGGSAVSLSAFYKRLAVGVLVIAVLCLLTEIALGFFWPTPTSSQQNVISSIDFGWKGGFGFVIGLFTGKGVNS